MKYTAVSRWSLSLCLIMMLSGCLTLDRTVFHGSPDIIEIKTAPENIGVCTLKNLKEHRTLNIPVEVTIVSDPSTLTLRCQPEDHDALTKIDKAVTLNHSDSPASLAGHNVLFPPGVLIDTAVAPSQSNLGYTDFIVPLIKGNLQTVEIDAKAHVQDWKSFIGTGYSNRSESGMYCDVSLKTGKVRITNLPQRIKVSRFNTPLEISCCRQSGTCASEQYHTRDWPKLYFDDGTAVGPYFLGPYNSSRFTVSVHD